MRGLEPGRQRAIHPPLPPGQLARVNLVRLPHKEQKRIPYPAKASHAQAERGAASAPLAYSTHHGSHPDLSAANSIRAPLYKPTPLYNCRVSSQLIQLARPRAIRSPGRTEGRRMDASSTPEEAARLWAELPVRVDWAAVAAQCAWLWARARALVVVPAVRLLLALSLAMTVMILVEKVFVCAVWLAVKAFRLRPERRYGWEPVASSPSAGDEEAGGGGATAHPMVLVQIPMYNEREVSREEQPVVSAPHCSGN
jgi:hypothetical protein